MKFLSNKITAASAGLFLMLFGAINTQAVTVDIYAGQNVYVGEAIAFTDQDALYMYVWIDPSWDVSQIHFQPVSSLSEFPVNGKGNPKIGKFDYSAEDFTTVDFGGYSYYYIRIPRNSFPNPASPTICASFHAVVSPGIGSGISGGSQTAWASGTQFTSGGSWASYFCVEGGSNED